MKLSAETVALLKNFSSVNQSILIRAGKQLRTMSIMKNILVEADIPESFTRDVAIYDLNQFLNCLSLVEDADVELEETAIRIANASESILYRYSDPSVITAPPEKELKLPSEDVDVVITEENIAGVKKAAAVLQIPDVSVVGDGETVRLVVRDKKNSGSNAYEVALGETEAVFSFNFKVENLKVVGGDYDVTISAKNPAQSLARFVSHGRPVQYFIALEPDSTFEG